MKVLLFFSFFTVSFSAQNWMALAAYPGIARDDGVAVEVDGKTYVGTGLKTGWALAGDFFALDLSTNSWTNITSMPLGAERQYACAFKGPSSFYVLAGDGSSGVLNTLYKYSIFSNTWLQMSSKPGAGVYGASVLEFGDKVILIGGRFAGGMVNQEVWQYNISSDAWLQKSNVPTVYGGRWKACATVLQGKGYCLFGIDANVNWRKEFLEYDPVNDSWQLLPSPPSIPSRAYASLEKLNNQLILFGGVDSLNTYSNAVNYFNPLLNVWTQGPALPGSARRGGMSWTSNNRFYYTCGLDFTETRLNETWLLDMPLGLSENENKSEFTIGPNPFQDQLFIYTEQKQKTFQLFIFDALGKNVLNHIQTERSGEGIWIHTELLKSGLYFLEIRAEDQSTQYMKIIKE